MIIVERILNELSYPNRFFHSIFLLELRKTTKTLSHDSMKAFPEYKSTALPIYHSVRYKSVVGNFMNILTGISVYFVCH
jgi:hypothetical protein